MKRIILCFDGTWDKPEDHTNVYHFYKSVRNDKQKQFAEYFRGVGTDGIADRILGGIFGEGISSKIKEGYAYLVQQYELGDEIFLVGFSRGAYTARSLVGLIRKAGLLLRTKIKDQEDLKDSIEKAYGLYRLPDLNPDTDKARTFRKEHSYYDASKENAGEPLYTNPVKIKFLGVWDTVGALGTPFTVLSLLGHSKEEVEEIKSEQFHDVKLSGLVENAFHALAIDEHRGDFGATLWNPEKEPQQRMEQVWFVGAHTDVGGGGGDSNDTLSKIALEWMQKKAIGCGLEFYDDKIVTTTPEDSLAEIYDSYTSFVNEHAKDIFERGRHYRKIGTTHHGHESIHESVNFRLNKDNQYRPQNPVGNRVSGRRKNAGKGKLYNDT